MKTTPNDKIQFILGRRSIRAFGPGAVSEDEVLQILQAAMAAPSAVAKDPWRFVVIRSPQMLAAIAEVLPNGRMLATAPLGIIVCGDNRMVHDGKISYLLQDCSAAIENLLLGAHALGLGACWLGVHPREDRLRHFKEVLGLPATVLPVACLAVGLPAEHKKPRTRFNAACVHFETW